MRRRSREEPFHIRDCTVKRVSKGAVLLESEHLLLEDGTWVPKSTFHEASDIDPESCEPGDTGDVAIQMWKAVDLELVDEEDEEDEDVFDAWD